MMVDEISACVYRDKHGPVLAPLLGALLPDPCSLYALTAGSGVHKLSLAMAQLRRYCSGLVP